MILGWCSTVYCNCVRKTLNLTCKQMKKLPQKLKFFLQLAEYAFNQTFFYLCSRVEWFTTFCDFRNWTHCCRPGLILWVQSKKSANLAALAAKFSFFQKETLKWWFFQKFENFFLLLQKTFKNLKLHFFGSPKWRKLFLNGQRKTVFYFLFIFSLLKNQRRMLSSLVLDVSLNRSTSRCCRSPYSSATLTATLYWLTVHSCTCSRTWQQIYNVWETLILQQTL